MYLKPFVDQARARGVEATAHAALGSPVDRILEALGESEGPLVVMSSHGRSGVRRWFLGSVTDKVMRTSGHPVLVVPPPDEDRPAEVQQ